MNLNLRKDIVKKSLIIENSLSEILLTLMDVESENSKTLGSKGSAFSFKNKTDFLFDIKRIPSKLYKHLIIFMEARNQFMHNLDADSFELVIHRIGKKSQLLSIDEKLSKIYKETKDPKTKESCLKKCFDLLFNKALVELNEINIQIIQEKISKNNQMIEQAKKENYERILEVMKSAVDEYIHKISLGFDVMNPKGGDEEMKQILQDGFTRIFKGKIEKEFDIKIDE